MKHKLYHIDAFTDELFKGNSACVVFLECELEKDILLKIASENAVAETAFILSKNGMFDLRWFTPDLEMDLCGHATLAAAFVVFNFIPEYATKDKVVFSTCEGNIEVIREKSNNHSDVFCLNFPVREGVKSELPISIRDSLNIQPLEVYRSRDYHLVYDSPEDVLAIEINRNEFDKINLQTGGVVISARGPVEGEECYSQIGEYDFVTRFFTPQSTILEDPVTGSAYCTLVPYWAARLNKEELCSKQVSERSGKLNCILMKNRVIIKGSAICYLTGEISINSF